MLYEPIPRSHHAAINNCVLKHVFSLVLMQVIIVSLFCVKNSSIPSFVEPIFFKGYSEQ